MRPAGTRTSWRVLLTLLALAGALAGPLTADAAALKPVNNLAPEVVGLPLLGERLVCGAGSWSGTVSGFSYEWLRDAIPVASGLTYTVAAADEGHSLWCVVSAHGAEGDAEQESSNSLRIPGGSPESAPVSLTPPKLSGGLASGETLVCAAGTWSGTPVPTFTYEWVRDAGVAESIVPAAVASSYTVSSEDEGHSLACRVTATNGAGSASRLSNSVAVPGTGPVDEAPPEVLGIEPPAVGELLTCSAGSWGGHPAPTFTYEWVRDRGLPDETVIDSADGSTYAVQPVDQLHTLTCIVTAVSSAGRATLASANTITVRGSRPEDTAAPTISGSPDVGAALSCEGGAWTGVPAPAIAYLWVRNQGMPDEEAIGSAVSSAYTVSALDLGDSLSCVVTATNSEGSAWQTSERVVVAASAGGSPPASLTAPEVLGSAVVGASLRCTEGTWSGSPAPVFTYRWLRDGLPIATESAETYVIAEADQGHGLSCEVFASNDEGVLSRSSGTLEIPGQRPRATAAPSVSGNPVVGQALTCLRGGWSGAPAPTFTYEWLRSGAPIPFATGSSYTVSGEDRGQSLSCVVTARNDSGEAVASSTDSLSVQGERPENSVAPGVSGTRAVGSTLTCSPGTWRGEPPPAYTYQWMLNGTPIPSATSNMYTIAAVDRGLALSCTVTASNREGSESAGSEDVRVPGVRPEEVEAPQVGGTPAVGEQVTCMRGLWIGEPPPEFTYQWLRDGALIPSATLSTYTVALGDEGHGLSCEVTATNGEGSVQVGASNSLAIARPALIALPAPQLTIPAATTVRSSPGVPQLGTSFVSEVALAQRRAKISVLRRTGAYTFSVAAPGPGRLAFTWSVQVRAAHGTSRTATLLVGRSTTSFVRPGAKSVTLLMTSAGRAQIAHAKWLTFTVDVTFLERQGSPVSWQQQILIY